MFKKIKKQNGEKFAQALRNFHNGLLEIPDLDVIVRHAGRDAEPLLPYLMGLMADNDNVPAPARDPADPFVLLEQAGYDAFYADTLEAQNSIVPFFAEEESLCTFDDEGRYQKYHIVHAVKKDAENIRRSDFTGKEDRQDKYGTSVISIQMLKKGGFISIKNRYNHAVNHCDNTFDSNPDNIIPGLSGSLKTHFNVEFESARNPLPSGFVLFGNRIFKYHTEHNNFYYGDQAWAKNGEIFTADRSVGDALFDGFFFNNNTKTLRKIDPGSGDSFAYDFNRCYGGNKSLCVRNGNLTLNGEILIGADQSRIKTLYLPALVTMGRNCLHEAYALTHFDAPALVAMHDHCLFDAHALTHFHAPILTTMGFECLHEARAIAHLDVPALRTMGNGCLYGARAITHFHAPELTTMGNFSLHKPYFLTRFHAPMLTTMGNRCLFEPHALTHFDAPALTAMGDGCLASSAALTHFHAPALITMGKECLNSPKVLTHFHAPVLTTMGDDCLHSPLALTHFDAPALTAMGNYCLYNAPALTRFNAETLATMGYGCLRNSPALTHFHAPALTAMDFDCLLHSPALTHFHAPALIDIGDHCLLRSPDILRDVQGRMPPPSPWRVAMASPAP